MSNVLVFVLELIGTAAFAVSGAIVGIKKQMDLFGVIVLGVCTAVGGGIVRDVPVSFDPSRREYAYRRVKERFLHKDEESDHDPMAELED